MKKIKTIPLELNEDKDKKEETSEAKDSAYLLQLCEEPDELLHVCNGGVEAWGVHYCDPGAGGQPEPGAAGVGARGRASNHTVTNLGQDCVQYSWVPTKSQITTFLFVKHNVKITITNIPVNTLSEF